jgi:ribose-phosphate pyrophosphokinase
MDVDGLKVKLFSLGSNDPIAHEISAYTKIPLSVVEVSKFSDGEVNINIEETVRGHHVFIIQSTNDPVNDNYMVLLIMIDALKRASAATINVVMPYYGYSRQDRKARSRQPISAKLVADLLQVAGTNRVITMDLHAAQIQGFYDIPIDNMRAFPVLFDYFKNKIKGDIVVVSPDHGGATRARKLATALDVPLAIIDKRRPKVNEIEIMSIIGDVEGKTCIIIDDIIDTAGTLTLAANALCDAGAVGVYGACTHGLFSGSAMERIDASSLTEVIVTNTIDLPASKQGKKVKVLSVSSIFGQAILNIIHNEPLSGLFERLNM